MPHWSPLADGGSRWPLQIIEGSESQRSAVKGWLGQVLAPLPAEVSERVVTAWVTAWCEGPYESLDDVPAGRLARRHRLTEHILEVTHCGLELASFVESEWQTTVDPSNLLCVLILHDVDKPILLERHVGEVSFSELAGRTPHGELGAMLLRDLGFPDVVVDTVATHAESSPLRTRCHEAWILHYADYFATDYVLLAAGELAEYQNGREAAPGVAIVHTNDRIEVK